tara:strand:+ start:5753 stop:6685 length:933 start_codon:yes stop_codon:yes gene_type:complete
VGCCAFGVSMIFEEFTYEALDALLDRIAYLTTEQKGIIKEQFGQPGLAPEINCCIAKDNEYGLPLGCLLMSREEAISRIILDFWIADDEYLEAINLDKEKTLQGMLDDCLNKLQTKSETVIHCCIPQSSYTQVFEASGFCLNRTYWKMCRERTPVPNLNLSEGISVIYGSTGTIEMLTKLQNDSFTGSWGFCPNTTDQISYKLSGAHTSNENVVFLMNGSDPVGYCWTYIYGEESSRTGAISMIGVSPNYRGKGMSGQLLYQGLDNLLSQGCDRVFLEVDSNNAPAIRIYESAGFSQIEELYWYELVTKG